MQCDCISQRALALMWGHQPAPCIGAMGLGWHKSDSGRREGGREELGGAGRTVGVLAQGGDGDQDTAGRIRDLHREAVQPPLIYTCYLTGAK